MVSVTDTHGMGDIGTSETEAAEAAALKWTMLGHGTFMILCTLLGGVGLWMYLLGGFEPVPGVFFQFQLPGSEEGWQRMHSGPAMNGLMVIAIAFVLPLLRFEPRTARILGWIVVLDGWANTGFYFFSNFSPNRGLAFTETHLGPADIFSALALAPAYIFGVLVIGAMAVIGWRAISLARRT